MNGFNVNIATGWTASTLANQKRSWTQIRGISGEIKKHADAAAWEDLLDLAEQRDLLIAEFLSHAICKPLFPTVVSELALIKEQHEQTMVRISVELERINAREKLIQTQREELTDCLNQDPNNIH